MAQDYGKAAVAYAKAADLGDGNGQITLGLMVAEGRLFLLRNPWIAVWPGLGIALVALGFNLFGDGLRDALNPRVGD